jgi:hypothetical protein
MQPDEFNGRAEPSRRSGGRFDLRFTRLALVLIVCLIVVPIVAIFALFTRRHADLENVNINTTVPPQAPSNYGGPILQPPANMPTPPKVRSPRGSEPARQTPAIPGLIANTPPTPSPTPSPPPRPPG